MMNRVDQIKSLSEIKLLIVEDHIELAENLYEYIGEQGYSLDFARDGLTALHLLATNQYDVIVLDLMLPGVNGFDICRRVRHDLQCSTPIIVMTALGMLTDKEKGFDAGADDYLVKPFELKELVLRINALHRRHASRSDGFSAGELHFDPGILEASYRGHKTILTGIPARLFELLIRAYPNFLSHESLQADIWGSDGENDNGVLRTHVYALRQTLQKAFAKDMIKTVYGRGYRLEINNHQNISDAEEISN